MLLTKKISTIGFPWVLCVVTIILLIARLSAYPMVYLLSCMTPSPIAWHDARSDKKSTKDNKKLFLYYFKSSTSLPCWLMDNLVFTNNSVVKCVNAYFIPMKVEMNANADGTYPEQLMKLRSKYSIGVSPALVVALPSGKSVSSIYGLNSSFPITIFLKEARYSADYDEGFDLYNNHRMAEASEKFESWLNKTRWLHPYTNWAVLVEYFSYRLSSKNKEAENLLQNAIKQIHSKSWPYAAIRFLHSDLSEKQLLDEAAPDIDRLSEAHYFIGMNDLVLGNKKQAKENFDWIKKNADSESYAYTRATDELKRLGDSRTN